MELHLSWYVALFGGHQATQVVPDALQLGQARVILDEGTLSGGITRDGSFLMCVLSPKNYSAI